MPNRPAGSDVATATYRMLGPVLGRLVPPWRPIRVVPEGLCAWADLWKVSLLAGGDWQLPLGLHLVPGHREIARLAGAAAQAGETRCPGMDVATGRLFWLPVAAWRTTPTYGNIMFPAERAAIRGRLLRIPGHSGIVVEPLFPLRDLAMLLGAANPPPPPSSEVLGAIEEPSAGAQSRRRRDQGSPTPAFSDAHEPVSESSGDPWSQEQGASAFSHGHPSDFGSPDATVVPHTGSDPSNAGAPGAHADGPANEVHDDLPEPEPRGFSLTVELGAHGEAALEVDPDWCAGRPINSGVGADAQRFDGAGRREPSADELDTDEAGRGRAGSAAGHDEDSTAAREDPPATSGTASAILAFGTIPSREARVRRKTGTPPKADHLTFPKATEWLSEKRRFESVTDLCNQLSAWLEEYHPESRMDAGSISGAFYKRRRGLLDKLCPPVPTPADVMPNGRSRTSLGTGGD